MSLFHCLWYQFVNLNFICNNKNLYICLSFHFTYDTDEEVIDSKIYLSIISNDVILMLLYPHIFTLPFYIWIDKGSSRNIFIKMLIVSSLNILYYIYDIHHCKILRSSYRKLAWVGFEPTTTEFRSNAPLTYWVISFIKHHIHIFSISHNLWWLISSNYLQLA